MKHLNFSIFVLLFFILLSLPLAAQYRMNYVPLYNYKDEVEPIQELLDQFNEDYSYENPISTLYDTLIYNTMNYKANDVPVYSSDVIQSRLRNLPTIINLDYNYQVQRFIDMYTIEKRDRVAKMLGLVPVYFPLFEAELDKRGMPMELKYLTIVESALNPHAKSRAGATGLWQFMLGTAQEYGLKIDSYVDERRDPYKSTVAAIDYLQKAYQIFGDWQLAIASYNCGAGNVKKAIARAGGVKDFWAIKDFLPAETRGYVPAFIAAVYSFSYASEHNIYPIRTDFILNQDTVHIKNLNISLYDIASMTGVDINELQNLNPELKLGIIPYSSYETYILRVPHRAALYFSQYAGYIADKYGSRYYTAYPTTASTPTTTTTTYYPATSTEGTSVASSNVGSVTPQGSIVGEIAIGSSFMDASPTEGDKEVATSKSVAKTTTPAKKAEPATTKKYHTIRKGDTLSEIAAKYNIGLEQLRKLNPGVSPRSLDVGDKLRVK